jgi:hypothetical protein
MSLISPAELWYAMNNVLHVSILIETISSALSTDGEYKPYIISNTLN